MTPGAVASQTEDALHGCGLSRPKARYLLSLAEHFTEGALDQESWHRMDDDAVIERLVQMKRIGRWTAEMFLIFHLLRPDVLPVADIGIPSCAKTRCDPQKRRSLWPACVGMHTKMSLNVRHRVVSPAGIDERTAPLEIRLKLQHANGLRGGRQHLAAEATASDTFGLIDMQTDPARSYRQENGSGRIRHRHARQEAMVGIVPVDAESEDQPTIDRLMFTC